MDENLSDAQDHVQVDNIYPQPKILPYKMGEQAAAQCSYNPPV